MTSSLRPPRISPEIATLVRAAHKRARRRGASERIAVDVALSRLRAYVPSAKPEDATALVGRTVLVVEDEFVQAVSHAAALRAAGHRVLGMAASYEGALRVLRKGTPDVAILDMRLAGEKDGLSLARHLRRSGIGVVFVTAYPLDVERARQLGAPVLPKPCDPASLADAVLRVA